MRVRFAARAEADLEDIASYIATDNPGRAASFVRELRDACLSLASYPLRFPKLTGVEDLDLRQMMFGRYRVLYRVDPDNVMIVRVLHSARDYPKVLLSDD